MTTQQQLRQANALVQKTAEQLHEIVVQMASSLVPFPYFLGSTEVQAVEADPGGVQRADRGCIVICADGEMYEFTMRVQSPGPGLDFTMDREDSVKPISLPPEEYTVYACNAIKEMAKLLEEQRARAKKYSF